MKVVKDIKVLEERELGRKKRGKDKEGRREMKWVSRRGNIWLERLVDEGDGVDGFWVIERGFFWVRVREFFF